MKVIKRLIDGAIFPYNPIAAALPENIVIEKETGDVLPKPPARPAIEELGNVPQVEVPVEFVADAESEENVEVEVTEKRKPGRPRSY